MDETLKFLTQQLLKANRERLTLEIEVELLKRYAKRLEDIAQIYTHFNEEDLEEERRKRLGRTNL